MDSQVQDLLNETSILDDEKKMAAKNMNGLAKDAEKSLNACAATMKKCKDYVFYKGKAWINGDPLNLDKDEKVKDKLSPMFRKLRDTVIELQSNGMIDVLKDYISALEGYGIHITIDPKDPDVNNVDEVRNVISSMCAYQQIITENSDIIGEEHAQQSEDLNFAPKTKYKEIFGFYSKKLKGKDVDDNIQDKVVFCEMYETALNIINDEVTSEV